MPKERVPTFACTRTYRDGLPGSAGSMLEMNQTAGRAIKAADRYIAEVLEPEINAILHPERKDGELELSRMFMFRNVLRAARLYDEALCDLYYDHFSGGTLRSIVSNNCAVANRDRLIDDLARLHLSIGPE